MKMRNGVLLAAVLSGVMSFPHVTRADQPVEPTETGEVGLLTIPTTKTLGAGKISLGTYYRNDIDNNEHFENELGQLRDTSVQQWSCVAGSGRGTGPARLRAVGTSSRSGFCVSSESSRSSGWKALRTSRFVRFACGGWRGTVFAIAIW